MKDTARRNQDYTHSKKRSSEIADWISNSSSRLSVPGAKPSGQTRQYVNQHAKRFADTFVLMEPFLHPNAKILDVGGGGGYFGYLMREFYPHPVEYEIVEGPASDICEFKTTNLDFDGVALPFSSNTYDLVICSEVLEHLIKDPYMLLKEINRVLGFHGLLVLTTPNASSASAMINLIRGRNPIWNPIRDDIYARHNKEYTYLELRKLAIYAGFEVSTEDTGFLQSPFHHRIFGTIICLLRVCPISAKCLGTTYCGVWKKIADPKERADFIYLD